MATQKWISDSGQSYPTEAAALHADIAFHRGRVQRLESNFLVEIYVLRRDADMWKTRYERTIDEAEAAEQARSKAAYERNKDDVPLHP